MQNEEYLKLTAMLLDAKVEASEAKKSGNKSQVKEISKKIKDYMMGMDFTSFLNRFFLSVRGNLKCMWSVYKLIPRFGAVTS